MNLKLSLVLCSVLFFVGCSEKRAKIKIKELPKKQVVKAPEPIVNNKGSLFTRKGPSLFSDNKELQVGDIILVDILAEADISVEDTRDDTKINNTQSNTGIGFTSPATISPGNQQRIDRVNGVLGIGLESGSNNDFAASVEQTAIDTVKKIRISVIIEEVYQNGNYFITGFREVYVKGQKQTIKISGVIRPFDIEINNEIKSEKIANLKISYEKEGVGLDNTEKPWGSRFFEAISPF
jgi:flagellar L-ring protein precursor FlgH